MSLFERIPLKASAYTNISTVLTRIQKRGHLNNLVSVFSQIKQAEMSELIKELNDPKEVQIYSTIFKDNMKLLSQIICILY